MTKKPQASPVRKLTKEEQAALAKVEIGYVSRSEDGELLIIDDSSYFRRCREEAEREAKALASPEYFRSSRESK